MFLSQARFFAISAQKTHALRTQTFTSTVCTGTQNSLPPSTKTQLLIEAGNLKFTVQTWSRIKYTYVQVSRIKSITRASNVLYPKIVVSISSFFPCTNLLYFNNTKLILTQIAAHDHTIPLQIKCSTLGAEPRRTNNKRLFIVVTSFGCFKCQSALFVGQVHLKSCAVLN